MQKAFEFLLDRESNTSILSRFDLFEISRYFPDFEQAIKKRLGYEAPGGDDVSRGVKDRM